MKKLLQVDQDFLVIHIGVVVYRSKGVSSAFCQVCIDFVGIVLFTLLIRIKSWPGAAYKSVAYKKKNVILFCSFLSMKI